MIVGTAASSRTVARVVLPSGATEYTDGTYNYVKFTTTGQFRVYDNKINFDAFLVGGGASGDFEGGGGGEVKTVTGNNTGFPYLSTYSPIGVVVGAGGAPYASGSQSSYASVSGSAVANPGLDTGVSGTGKTAGSSISSYTRQFYFDEFGSIVYYNVNTGYAGGGGGGSSAKGGNASGSPGNNSSNYIGGGNGGAGDANPYAGVTSSLSRMGGGGAGDMYWASSPYPSLNPGTVADGASITDASPNSGGGSGGALFGGHNGGSGIVIIKYLKSEVSK